MKAAGKAPAPPEVQTAIPPPIRSELETQLGIVTQQTSALRAVRAIAMADGFAPGGSGCAEFLKSEDLANLLDVLIEPIALAVSVADDLLYLPPGAKP